MVVSDKIQQAKACFKEINKSGRNNYQKYDYLETKDIFPIVRNICEEFKLKTKFEWCNDDNTMKLIVTDKEDGTVDTSTIPLAPVTATDCGKYMQDVGRIQTYAMRYLYIQVFEIAVPDEIDNKDQKLVKANKPKPALKKKNVSPVKPVKEKKSVEVTAERVQEILSNAQKVFDEYMEQKPEKDRKPFTWSNAKFVIKQQCRNEHEYNACSQSLVFKKATDIQDDTNDF